MIETRVDKEKRLEELGKKSRLILDKYPTTIIKDIPEYKALKKIYNEMDEINSIINPILGK